MPPRMTDIERARVAEWNRDEHRGQARNYTVAPDLMPRKITVVLSKVEMTIAGVPWGENILKIPGAK